MKTTVLSEVTQVGYQEVQQRKLFGPVYHGTTPESFSQILQTGFKVPNGVSRADDSRHGYEFDGYGRLNIPPPVHHLGYGIYFTQSKSIAKNYNMGTGKQLPQFYLDVPRLETINFGAVTTMMKWWYSNGYNMPSLTSLQNADMAEKQRLWVEATRNLTKTLSSKYDAVLFTGKGFRGSLLDGNQICVYDPARIYLFKPELNDPNTILAGDRVKIKGVPIAVVVTGARENRARQYPDPWDLMFGETSEFHYTVSLKPKDFEILKNTYYAKIYDTVLNNENIQQLMSMRAQNSGLSKEDNAKSYAEYTFSKSLAFNFPQSLIEKKLAKGARVL